MHEQTLALGELQKLEAALNGALHLYSLSADAASSSQAPVSAEQSSDAASGTIKREGAYLLTARIASVSGQVCFELPCFVRTRIRTKMTFVFCMTMSKQQVRFGSASVTVKSDTQDSRPDGTMHVKMDF